MGAADGPLATDVLGSIPVKNEQGAGYDRRLFPTWFDLDRDGCDARAQGLVRDSTTPAVLAAGCAVTGGTWVSTYDGITTTDPSEVEVDHVVALKEAWDSGASAWSPEERTAYANDTSDPRTLRTVSATSNASKGDADPSNWMPPNRADWCRYAGDVVAVKARWGLSMDQSEGGRIKNVLNRDCAGMRLEPNPPLPAFAPAPPTTAPPATTGAATTATPRSTAPPTAASVYYQNCTEARAAGAAPLYEGEPGYRSGLDRDHDGVACE
jgi:hypothetical protein